MRDISAAAKKMILVIVVSSLVFIAARAAYGLWVYYSGAEPFGSIVGRYIGGLGSREPRAAQDGTARTMPVAGIIYFALGVTLMGALNVLKVLMLERAVHKAVDMGENGVNYMKLQHIIRQMLTAAVLVAAALLRFIDLWGAIAGVFTFQIAALAVRLFGGKMEVFTDGDLSLAVPYDDDDAPIDALPEVAADIADGTPARETVTDEGFDIEEFDNM